MSPDQTGSIDGFDHVSLPMRDTDAMVAFYRSLGLEVAEHPHVVSVYAGDQMINFIVPTIWQREDFTLRAPAAKPPCGDLCFVWDGSTESLHALLDDGRRHDHRGPGGTRRRSPTDASSVYVRDPDGNLLEFMIYPPTVEKEVQMPADIVIRGGTVFDGSGAPGRAADVAIAGGAIREIGPNLRGERELDASGCAVAPGFIDIHTHYDAQVFWDPALRPSSYHGVTTVVAGNCGFTIAPTRPEHHDVIVRTLENVEDMDPATLAAGVAWDFETFPEYLESVRRRGTVLNFTAYIGHSALRLYVMGDAAYERAATADEIERMCALVREAIERGRGRLLDQLLVRAPRRRRQAGPEPLRRARRGRRAVPRRGRGGQGRGAHHAGRAVHLRRRLRMAAARRAAVHLSAVRGAGREAPRAGRAARAGAGARRGRLAAGHAAAAHHAVHDWPTRTASTPATVFGELLQGDRDARIAAYRDPDVARRAPRPTWSSRR